MVFMGIKRVGFYNYDAARPANATGKENYLPIPDRQRGFRASIADSGGSGKSGKRGYRCSTPGKTFQSL
jgi:hypothetical protein